MPNLLLLAILITFSCFIGILPESQATEIDLSKKKEGMRDEVYKRSLKHLEELNDNDLLRLLKQGKPVHSGIGGTSLLIEIDGIPIFVKQIPLNQKEGLLENTLSTQNLFELPLYYQYGVGSAGFSAWREVSAHLMSTEWVLFGKNGNFPLMYHWRILPRAPNKMPLSENELNDYVAYWQHSSAIGERYKANYDTLNSVTIFVEYLPETLTSWLSRQFTLGNEAIDKALGMVEKNLKETILFMNAHEMLHFDAHFKNILTDGEQLYFSDFGLATSSQFALSIEEREFFQKHQHYDRCFMAMELTNWMISKLYGKEHLFEILQDYADGKTPLLSPEGLTPKVSTLLRRYAAIAHKMNTFFNALIKETKFSVYPEEELEQLWIE